MGNKWSKELQELSIDVIWNGRCMEPCRVKHWRKENSFGSVSVIQGINGDGWDVLTDNGEVEKFSTVEDLVAAGWVVD